MAQDRRYECNDLVDYEVLDATDTLAGVPGDDPLDRGVVAPLRWSAAIRSDITVADQDASRSLSRSLSAEEPDISPEPDSLGPDSDGWDENATEDDIRRIARDTGPDPRAGRLTAEDDVEALIAAAEYVAHDAGTDGGGATAEEAAVHLIDDES
jgi:hypothetical protein